MFDCSATNLYAITTKLYIQYVEELWKVKSIFESFRDTPFHGFIVLSTKSPKELVDQTLFWLCLMMYTL